MLLLGIHSETTSISQQALQPEPTGSPIGEDEHEVEMVNGHTKKLDLVNGNEQLQKLGQRWAAQRPAMQLAVSTTSRWAVDTLAAKSVAVSLDQTEMEVVSGRRKAYTFHRKRLADLRARHQAEPSYVRLLPKNEQLPGQTDNTHVTA